MRVRLYMSEIEWEGNTEITKVEVSDGEIHSNEISKNTFEGFESMCMNIKSEIEEYYNDEIIDWKYSVISEW